MNIISRLLAKDSGLIMYKDKDLFNYKSKDLSKEIAILTQSNNTNMKLTVKELISFGRFPYSGTRLNNEDYDIIEKSIDYMELKEIEDKFIDEISGGQKQRAYIAMVIAQDTDYILLDEPTNNLDIYHSKKMMNIIRNLCDDLGKTIILVLHDINYASFYSDYICAFKDGEIIKFDETKNVITSEVLKSIYNVDFNIQTINNKNLCIYY
ncbi:MAG: ATP-binding cassette domain-containing protein, partial [Oscillospiraceae bacterium]